MVKALTARKKGEMLQDALLNVEHLKEVKFLLDQEVDRLRTVVKAKDTRLQIIEGNLRDALLTNIEDLKRIAKMKYILEMTIGVMLDGPPEKPEA